MADGSYTSKVYMKVGGDELVVASGGKITVEAGGSVVGGGDVTPQSNVADIGASNLAATTITLSTTNTYTDAAVKTAVDTGLAGVTAKAETRFDAVDTKINALLAAMRLAGVLTV
ncbi:hypothetical protein [Mesorhizobium sp. M0118]|uniref:hypothetical protein n=1 Tax=Mesorhizobium sp. M0118 TaxID=2956884 RepID=UPI003337224F